jgi:hypothetical protein
MTFRFSGALSPLGSAYLKSSNSPAHAHGRWSPDVFRDFNTHNKCTGMCRFVRGFPVGIRLCVAELWDFCGGLAEAPDAIISQRQGTILKKCKCANQDRCSHKWTLRYWADGRQRGMSSADELDGEGRPRYGSGKRLAQDAQLKIAYDKRARVFIDPSWEARDSGMSARSRSPTTHEPN